MWVRGAGEPWPLAGPTHNPRPPRSRFKETCEKELTEIEMALRALGMA